MTYVITAAVINKDRKGECPVSYVVRRRLKKSVIVGHEFIYIGNRRRRLPERVAAWVKCFDQHRAVVPFRFTWPSPTW